MALSEQGFDKSRRKNGSEVPSARVFLSCLIWLFYESSQGMPVTGDSDGCTGITQEAGSDADLRLNVSNQLPCCGSISTPSTSFSPLINPPYSEGSPHIIGPHSLINLQVAFSVKKQQSRNMFLTITGYFSI